MTMPHLDHVALWAVDLDSARDFYSHWFDGHANGLYENPRTGLRTHILHFAETPEDERGTRLEIMTRPDLAEGRERRAGVGSRLVWPAGARRRRPPGFLHVGSRCAGRRRTSRDRRRILRGHRA